MAASSKKAASGKKALSSKKAAKAAAPTGLAGVASWPGRLSAYYQEIKREMRLVTWPGREQVKSTTVVVLATVAFFGVFFAVVDYILGMGQTGLYGAFR